jgi:hypothetical protein
MTVLKRALGTQSAQVVVLLLLTASHRVPAVSAR